MSKSENAFRTITEAAIILDLPPHVLRFWESKFKYIKPLKRGGGRRYYRPEDLNLLRGIKHLLHNEGLTIKGAQKVIQTTGVKNIANIGKKNKEQGSGRDLKPNSQQIPTSKISAISLSQGLDREHRKKIHQLSSERLKRIICDLKEVCDVMKSRLERS